MKSDHKKIAEEKHKSNKVKQNYRKETLPDATGMNTQRDMVPDDQQLSMNRGATKSSRTRTNKGIVNETNTSTLKKKLTDNQLQGQRNRQQRSSLSQFEIIGQNSPKHSRRVKSKTPNYLEKEP